MSQHHPHRNLTLVHSVANLNMSNHHEHEKNPDNVARGLKAAIHNPNVSEEAKQSAAERLEQMGSVDEHEQHGTNRQLGGYKATLTNPNTSQKAKEHARQVLGQETEVSNTANDEGETHDHRVIGGYKAALKNPNVSEEAKQHAEEFLKEHNALPSQ
ncbi:Conidiation protein 6-domain-containing protein [Crassisporium funariophilum]|nr:Conidiation protein 6-domain-containing protein [Crassisporium funariophilum]